MPYKANEIPSGTERVPEHGQSIYRAAFNSAHAGGASEESAHAIAWSAVKRKYKKHGDRWISKDGDAVMRALGDRDFSTAQRKRATKTGAAMPGGGYPIENEEDLHNAIRAFGRAKNKAATKAHIKTRARALGKTSLLPENWDAAMITKMTAPVYDAWMEISDDHECPDCLGEGEHENAAECGTCGGKGYLIDAKKKPDDDDDDDDVDDAQSVQFFDAFVMDAVRRTKDGYLVADARIARTGIQLYAGSEIGKPDMEVVRVYRSADEVFSKTAMQSLAHRPITLTHPPTMVDARNWKDYAVGQTGDEVTRDGDCVRVPMVIMDAKAIDAYARHGVKELSVGYSTELKWGQGKTPDGEIYDAKQTAIRGNHLAVVPAARGGSRLRIGDDDQKGNDMVKTLIDGHTVEFGDELVAKHVQNYIASLQKELADAKAKEGSKKEEAGESAKEEQEEEKKLRAEKDAMQGELLVVKQQLADANAKLTGKALDEIVKQRTDLLLKADAILEGKVSFDGKEPNDIRRMVVLAKIGDAAKDLTDDQIAGAFTALSVNVKPRTGVDRLADNLSLLNAGGGNNNDDPKAIKDAAYGEYNKYLNNAWKGARAQ